MEILKKETYLKMIENSINARMFNSILIKEESGVSRDLLNDGEYSCALFVSSVLFLNNLIQKTRSTVNNLEKDLLEHPSFIHLENGADIEPGDILFWESVTYEDDSANRHVGFAVSNSEAISTSYMAKCVIKHPITKEIENSGEMRKVENIFRFTF
jgi:hypothetical protein